MWVVKGIDVDISSSSTNNHDDNVLNVSEDFSKFNSATLLATGGDDGNLKIYSHSKNVNPKETDLKSQTVFKHDAGVTSVMWIEGSDLGLGDLENTY